MSVLEVSALRMQFGGLVAVDNVDLTINKNEIVSLIGPNGAGKTTVFNCISGFYKPTAGSIVFSGKEVAKKPGHELAQLGMVRTFQNVRLFQEMTVLENLLVAQHKNVNRNLLSGLIQTKNFKKSEALALDNAAHWLENVGLLEFANREAGNLAYGQQRRLEIARCMVTDPQLIMLDEPAAGLNPKETADLDELINRIRGDFDKTVLLIEHDMKLVMEISDRIYVVNQGRPLANGIPEDIRNNDDVIKAYLGES